jgi:hypothetical protein
MSIIRSLLGGVAAGALQTTVARPSTPGLAPSRYAGTKTLDGPVLDPLDIDFTTGTLDSRITFARASTATYIDASGLVASAASGAPRFDYDPVALTPRGLLLEEQQTNELTHSGDIGDAAWAGFVNGSGSSSRTSAAGTAPDGTTTATLCAIDRSTPLDWAQAAAGNFTSGSSQPCTSSIWLKAYTGGDVGKVVDIMVYAGGNVGLTHVTLTADWVRYDVTGTVGATGCQFIIGYISALVTGGGPAPNVDTGSIQFLAWGAQAEFGAFATSYIPTTSTAVTRAADTAEMTGANFSSWYNASAGTFVVEYRPQSVSGTQPVISVNDTTANEAIHLYGSGTDPKAIVVDGGTTQADLDAGTIAANTFYKLGLAFTLNDFAACLDGGTVATDATGTLPTVTQLQFHTDIAGNVANLHIKRLQYFNTRKTDVELQALTALSSVTETITAGTVGIVGQAVTEVYAITEPTITADTVGIVGQTVASTLGYTDAITAGSVGIVGQTVTPVFARFEPAITAGTVGIAGQTIALVLGFTDAITAGSVGIVGQTVTPVFARFEPAITAGTVPITGQTVASALGYTDAITAGTVPIVGQTITPVFGRTDAITAGSVPIVGQTVTPVFAITEALTAGAVPITGQTVTPVFGRTDAITAGTVPIAGQTVASAFGRVDAITAGSVPITGQTVTPVFAITEAITAGAVPITGQSITPIFSAGGINYSDTITAGTVPIVGQTVAPVFAITEAITADSVPITGSVIAPFLSRAFLEAITAGTVPITGQTITPVFGSGPANYTITIVAGAVPITGATITPVYVPAVVVVGGPPITLRGSVAAVGALEGSVEATENLRGSLQVTGELEGSYG